MPVVRLPNDNSCNIFLGRKLSATGFAERSVVFLCDGCSVGLFCDSDVLNFEDQNIFKSTS